jgi:hypothetical protein
MPHQVDIVRTNERSFVVEQMKVRSACADVLSPAILGACDDDVGPLQAVAA